MPVLLLTRSLNFPDVSQADEDGLLAVGGDLSLERLKLAYSKGIFPWFNDDSPILWWSPDPRMVLFPEKLKVSQSLRQVFRKGSFKVTLDHAFAEVIHNCAATPRKDEDGTWITSEMQQAYIKLHEAGLAHSVEAWQDGKLVGGLYGVALGKVFCGESMFHHLANASKVAFCYLVEKLIDWDFEIIDSQVHTDHLESLGAELIPRSQYLEILERAIAREDIKGSWRQRE